jgi:hypothetical protein
MNEVIDVVLKILRNKRESDLQGGMRNGTEYLRRREGERRERKGGGEKSGLFADVTIVETYTGLVSVLVGMEFR